MKESTNGLSRLEIGAHCLRQGQQGMKKGHGRVTLDRASCSKHNSPSLRKRAQHSKRENVAMLLEIHLCWSKHFQQR